MVVSLCVCFLWRDVVVYEGGGREKGLGYLFGNRTVDPYSSNMCDHTFIECNYRAL